MSEICSLITLRAAELPHTLAQMWRVQQTGPEIQRVDRMLLGEEGESRQTPEILSLADNF